jgi:uncharacterized coiled-coil protein SlyX
MEQSRNDALAPVEKAIVELELQTTLQLARIGELAAGLSAARSILHSLELSLVELNKQRQAFLGQRLR